MNNMQQGLVEVICDLIRINKNRFNCYRNVITETEDMNLELIEIFINKANKSRRHANELAGLLISPGYQLPENLMVPGKIFRSWESTKKMFNGNDRKALLKDCEFGEENALEAYQTALTSDSLNDYISRKLIMDQKFSLQKDFVLIKRYRDMQDLVLLTSFNLISTWNQYL